MINRDRTNPFPPENGQSLRFKIGDRVIFTNDYGVVFDEFSVTGYYTEGDLYQYGYRYLLDWDCPWFPVKESSLQHYQQ